MAKDDQRVRPLTDEQKVKALELANSGKDISSIRQAIGVDVVTFWRQRRQDDEFRKEFAQARHEGLEELADELLTIADDYADVLKARLKSENIRWVLSKRKAEVYGDRVDVNLTHTVDIGGALAEARARVRPTSDLKTIDVTHIVETTQLIAERNTGSQPVAPTEPHEKIEDDDIFS